MKGAWRIVLLAAAWTVAAPLAVVLKTSGTVEMGTGGNFKTVRSGDLVLSEWLVRTGADGRARIRLLADKTLIDLAPSSALAIDRLNRQDKTIRRTFLQSGEARFSVPQDSTSDLRIETPTTIATVRGGEFGMTLRPDGTTSVSVQDGTVKVCNPITGEHSTLPQGTTQSSSYDGILGLPATVASSDSTVTLDVRMIDRATGRPTTIHYDFRTGR